MQEDDTLPICIKAIELERLIQSSNICIQNAHEIYEKYLECWDCEGYNKDCGYFRSQYLMGKMD